MRMRAVALAALCAVMGIAVLAAGATAGHHHGKKHKHKNKNKVHKVSICHRTGDASYVLIRIDNHALKAHLKHGDAYPGTAVAGGTLSSNCAVVPPPPQSFTSPPLQFGPNGWGGWSCPSGMKAVGGSTTLTSVAAQGVAEPGATIGGSTYPVFPHYTFAAGETGYVVQNDNDTETGTVTVLCVPV